MNTAVWIVGISVGVFVALVLAVIVAWYWIKWKLRKFFNSIGDAFSAIIDSEPPRMTLVPDEFTKPAKQQLVWKMWCKGFEDAGFHRIGQFKAKESDELLLTAFVDEARGMYGVVYCLPSTATWTNGGVWVDVVSRLENGKCLTHTTAKATGMDRPDFAPMVRMKTEKASELVEGHLKDRGTQRAKPVAASGFKHEFQREYARQMDWRMLRGVTDDEIRRIGELSDEKKAPTPESIKLTRIIATTRYSGMLDQLLTKQFKRDHPMVQAEWERVEPRLVFVHDKSIPSLLAGVLGPVVLTTNDMPEDPDSDTESPEHPYKKIEEEIEAKPRREVFREIAARAPSPHIFKQIGVVEGLVTADVWVRPEFEPSGESEYENQSDDDDE